MKIKYVAFYHYHSVENRDYSPAATNKIDYISNSIVELGHEVEIISPSWTINSQGFYCGETKEIANRITLKTFSTFGGSSKLTRGLKYLFSMLQLFIHLLVNTKKGELVIVYHSVMLSLPIRVAKIIKRFRLVLEIEEIYQDAQTLSNYMKKNELFLFKAADKFILSTDSLKTKLKIKNIPSVTINGIYKAELPLNERFDDNKIHLVYAGTFDPKKGGVYTAIESAVHLPEKYHLHVVGFGSESQLHEVNQLIKKVDSISDSTITYDGLLKGKDFTIFLQKCHIGLSTQNPESKYNDTSFPSKILSYLANGIRVVTIRIRVVEKSTVGNIVIYFDEPLPEKIAEAIKSVNLNEKYDSRELLNNLDEKFKTEINELLEMNYAKKSV